MTWVIFCCVVLIDVHEFLSDVAFWVSRFAIANIYSTATILLSDYFFFLWNVYLFKTLKFIQKTIYFRLG